MNSRDYWAEREAKALKDYITEEKEYSKRINEIYEETLQGIQSEIDAFYRKYAIDNKISLREAKKRVRKLDIAEYERKAKRYVKNKDFSKKANEEMRIYNLTMKINRLEMLKANIGLEQLKGASKLERFFYKILNRRALKEYERQAGILGKSVRDNAKLAHAVVNASFRGMNFSDRIWTNSAAMKADLDRLITTGLIRGKNPRVLAREMRKHVIGGEGAVGAKYHAERLMRTELARVQTEAQKQSMEENGFELYQFFVNGGCCSACEEVAKKKTKYGTGVYRIKDLQPGLNAAPIHPNCRCSIAPYEDSDEYKAWLDFLDKGGTTKEWEKSIEKSRLERGGSKRIGTNRVDLNYIKSEEFRHKFNKLTNNTSVNDALRNYATAMLVHRNGTDGEDLYIIDAKTGDLIVREISSKGELEVKLDKSKAENIRENHFGETIGIHNHPTNVLPTGSDFTAAGYRGYDFGVVVTHTGRVFKYKCGDRPFLSVLLDKKIDKYTQKEYNMTVEDAYKKALNELRKEYGIKWEEL